MKQTLALLMCYILCSGLNLYAAEQPLAADQAYNQGVDFYKKSDYNKAGESFLQSMNTQDKRLEQWSAYNLGSAFFGQAQNAEQKDPAAANQIYQKALDFFKRAIQLEPRDKDAKYNYELTTKKIIEQEQKDKQNQQDKQKKQDQQNKPDQENQQDQQNQQQKQEQKQEQKDQQQQPDKQDGAAAKNEQNKSESGSKPNEQRRQMTQQEAKMLLDNFQQSEDKKKEMDLYKAQQQEILGIKGW